jgi:ABC-type thiamine transport system ATPase subunit
MPNAAITLRRLLQSLEDIGLHEDCALASSDGRAFLALEQRAEPLVRRVISLVMDTSALDPALRERGAALVASRSERRLRLVRLLETTHDDISRLTEARARVHALRPAYASNTAAPTPRFAACA